MKKPIITALATLIFISPLYAEEVVPAEAGQAEAAPEVQPGAMEQRIRSYRESYDRGRTDQPAYESGMSQQQQQVFKQMEAQRQAYLKQVEERRALNEKWREARRKYQEARLETWLKESEDRLQQDVSRHESLRNQAEDRHNYLVENQERLIQESLKQQVEAANRHEELRKQAEERRRELVTLREKIRNMTPEELRAEISSHEAGPHRAAPEPGHMAPPSHVPWHAWPPHMPHARPPLPY